jgi:hypothetical protein
MIGNGSKSSWAIILQRMGALSPWLTIKVITIMKIHGIK